MGHGDQGPDGHLPLQPHGDVEGHHDEEDDQGPQGLVSDLVAPRGADLFEGLHGTQAGRQGVAYLGRPGRVLNIGSDEEHLVVHHLDPGVARS